MEKHSHSFEDTMWQYLLRIPKCPYSKVLHLLIILSTVGEDGVSKPKWAVDYLHQPPFRAGIWAHTLFRKHWSVTVFRSWESVNGKPLLVACLLQVMKLVKKCSTAESALIHLTRIVKREVGNRSLKWWFLLWKRCYVLNLHATFKKNPLNHFIQRKSLLASSCQCGF